MDIDTSISPNRTGTIEPSWLRRLHQFVGYGVSLFPIMLAGCLLLSWAVSLVVPGLTSATGCLSFWAGGGLYVALFCLLAWIVRKAGSIPEHRVIWGLIGLSVLMKLGLVFFSNHLPLHADQELFHYFVREMSDHHLQSEVLSGLSAIYDYPVWAGRVLPVHYLVRYLAADQDVLWIRLLNVGLSTGIVLVSYGFACRLLPEGRRKWVVFLMVALPFQSFVTTDYSHHIFSSFYFLLYIWCAWEMVFSAPRLIRRLGLSVVSGGCLLLMMWQRGVHLIALGVVGIMLLWAGIKGVGWKQWGLFFLSILVIPLLLSVPFSVQYDQWLSRHDTHQLNSILPAFTARGWCPESAGEYCGRYEQLDRVTPWPHKKSAMNRLVLSQIRYNPATVCVRFPFLKTAKLFLVGYAANFEESLAQSRSSALCWVRGVRMAATPIFLGLALLGCLGLAVRPEAQSRWMPIFLVPLLTWGAYVFLGETSPRYSIFCQPFLGLLGAWTLSRLDQTGLKVWALPRKAWRHMATRGLVATGGVVLALGLLVIGVRQIPEAQLYADLRQGWNPVHADVVGDGDFMPFEARLFMEPGHGPTQASWTPPFPSEIGRKISFYILGTQGRGGAAQLTISMSDQVLKTVSLHELNSPRYIELDLPPTIGTLEFSLESIPGVVPTSGSVQIGYVTFPGKDSLK